MAISISKRLSIRSQHSSVLVALLLLTMLVVPVPALAAVSVDTDGFNSSAASVSGIVSQTAISERQDQLLQYTAGGHILGFQSDGLYVASSDHVLHVGFVGTTGVTPDAVNTVGNNSKAQPLNRVTYTDLWSGISLRYEADAGGIAMSTWEIAAGGRPEQIRLRYNAPLEIATDGSLKINYKTGWMRESAPIAWQEIDGRRHQVKVAFRLLESPANEPIIGFEVDHYDSAHPLLIDPTLEWNTFMGSSIQDHGNALVVDSSGNVYVAGYSRASWGTPVNAFVYDSRNNDADAFVAKLDANGSLLWNTFMGSINPDEGQAIAVDGSGNVYVAGFSYASWGTPVNAYSGGFIDAFAAKLDTNGNRVWNTFMGSASPYSDHGWAIAVDGSDNVYVAGSSNTTWGTPVNPHAGESDIFAAKLDTNGVRLWNTFMGSLSHFESGYAITVDGSGNIYVAGSSRGTWGTPVNPHAGGDEAFVAKLNTNGARLWNTFMGSADGDSIKAISADANGNLYVAGFSSNTWGTPINAYAGSGDAFVAKLNTNGARLWNTFMGSADGDSSYALVVGGGGDVYVAGSSSATWGTPANPFAGNSTDAFAAKLDSNGVQLWNTFMGSTSYDSGQAIAVDGSDNIYVAGFSYASWGSPENRFAGGEDAFVVKLCASVLVRTSAPADVGSFTPTIRGVCDAGNTTTFNVNAEPGYSINTVTGCGGTWTGSNPYTTGPITAECTVAATFNLNSYTVAASVDANGSLDSTSKTVEHGSTASFTVTPDIGYTTNTAIGGDCLVGSWNGSTYTTGVITGACSVSFTNTLNNYTVSTSAPAAQGGFIPTSRVVGYGDRAIFNVYTNPGYIINTVTGCGGSWIGSNPFITGSIIANCTVAATFTNYLEKPSIQVSNTATPSVLKEPGGTVAFNVAINNTSATNTVTINTLTDILYGNLNGEGNCSVPRTIAAGGHYNCAFDANITGSAGVSETDTVTASGADEYGNPVSDSDSATVKIIPPHGCFPYIPKGKMMMICW